MSKQVKGTLNYNIMLHLDQKKKKSKLKTKKKIKEVDLTVNKMIMTMKIQKESILVKSLRNQRRKSIGLQH